MSKIISNDFDCRTKLLLGEYFDKMKDFNIAVCGIGGVGSIIPLSLVRSGIKNITIVDFDSVDITNLNRQLAYDLNDVGKFKVDAMETKLLALRKDLTIKKIQTKIDANFDFFIFNKCNFIFDCIDDISAKVILIKYCIDNNLNFISSLGMGNRLDSTKVTITTLNKTFEDHLAKKLRYLLKQENIDLKKVYVAFSNEKPLNRGRIVSSMIFVPNSSGLAMASFALTSLLGIKK